MRPQRIELVVRDFAVELYDECLAVELLFVYYFSDAPSGFYTHIVRTARVR